jgi:site-specific DNA-cytosine methylase
MKVLVACEFSQIVTKAFRDRGHEAYSCDILPTEGNPEWHIQDDVLKHLYGATCPRCKGMGYMQYPLYINKERCNHDGVVDCYICGGRGVLAWDLMIAHPPCTDLSVAGAAYWKVKQQDGRQKKAIQFFMKIAEAPINKIVIENPPGIMTKAYRKPDQYIQPYEFGHPFKKKTGLWLKNLPCLTPTNIVEPTSYWSQPHGMAYKNKSMRLNSCGGHRMAKIRSRSFQGIAQAMAEQWG